MHAALEALLRRYCEDRLVDYAGLKRCIETSTRPPDHIVEAFAKEFGVTADAWGKTAPLAKRDNVSQSVTRMLSHRESASLTGRSLRRPSTPEAAAIQAWMDSAGITSVAELAARVSAIVGRKIGRGSLRNYIDGSQRTSTGVVPASVPADVVAAVEQISGGQITASSWHRTRR